MWRKGDATAKCGRFTELVPSKGNNGRLARPANKLYCAERKKGAAEGRAVGSVEFKWRREHPWRPQHPRTVHAVTTPHPVPMRKAASGGGSPTHHARRTHSAASRGSLPRAPYPAASMSPTRSIASLSPCRAVCVCSDMGCHDHSPKQTSMYACA